MSNRYPPLDKEQAVVLLVDHRAGLLSLMRDKNLMTSYDVLAKK